MSQGLPGTPRRPVLRNLFALLLTFWSEHRRIILLVLIAVVLGSFVQSLSDQTRRLLIAGFFAQRALVVLLLLFNLLMLSLLLSAGQRLDLAVFMLFNLRGHHPLWLDRVMWGFTQIGNGFAGILLGIIFYYAGNRSLAVELLLGILSLWLAVELIKALVERTRPFLVIEGTRVIGWKERGLSFPSGHTSQAFFMATLFSHTFGFGPLFGIFMFGIAIAVAFTRIYVGAHYPRDVIGGAILGSVWGILTGLVEIYLQTGQL